MRNPFLLIAILFCASLVMSQTPTPVAAPSLRASITVKMPEARSTELKTLQAQADKLLADFEAAMAEINLRARVLITQAALEARLTPRQLDSMELVLDAKGNYEWRPRPVASPQPKSEPKSP